MKAVVFTLGCKVNECESDSILQALFEKGYDISDKLEFADIYIINTCAITSEAEKKSRQAVSRVLKLNPNAKVIVTGCAAEKNLKNFDGKKNVTLLTGTFGKDKISEMLDEYGTHVFPQTTEYEEMCSVKSLRSRAYVKVQDGCNNFCSYCIVPYLRGRSRSRNPENVIKEISSIKPKEAVINGINLSAYNYNGVTLTGLMMALKDQDTRIRLGSLEVGVIDRDFLTAVKELKDFAPHFHLSLQSGSNAVLKSMNRHYTADEYAQKVDLIREFFPDAGITTDIIVGFPTETEENFIETLNFVDRIKFSDIHPFIFSPRSGTVAYKMKDLPPEIKKARLDKLMVKKQECKLRFSTQMIGKTLDFIQEEKKDGYYQGYSENYLRLYVKDLKGKFDGKIKVKIKESFRDGAIAEVLE